jgi:integrative and conjugative element protein (TIGR02256 family)
MIYPVVSSGQRIVFTETVLKRFAKFRQTKWWQREAGGQLFAQVALPEIVIVDATGPRRSDWRTRHSYRPNRRAEQREINERHPRGLHFIGDWHTHPEDLPVPSSRDEQSMHEVFTQSNHALNGFVLVIVGRLSFPQGLAVWLYNGTVRARLECSDGQVMRHTPDTLKLPRDPLWPALDSS